MREGRLLAIIPARGGSKGLPRKNIAPLSGRPLISWTIAAALAAESADRIVVSTDDEEIAAAARTAGADVPFLRPAAIAADTSTVEEVIDHALLALKEAGDPDYDHILLLQPTSPLRTGVHIRGALELYDGKRPVVSVCRAPEKSAWLMRKDAEGSVRFCFAAAEKTARRRQELPELFYPNGAIYIAPAALARTSGFYAETTIPFIMHDKDSLDIDGPEDLRRVEDALSA